MAYGLSTRAFIEDGPAEQVAKLNAGRTTARAWRVLVHPSQADQQARVRFRWTVQGAEYSIRLSTSNAFRNERTARDRPSPRAAFNSVRAARY